jgi:hypothetical protein
MGKTGFNEDVLTFDPPEITQTLSEPLNERVACRIPEMASGLALSVEYHWMPMIFGV